MRVENGLVIFGNPEPKVQAQIERCAGPGTLAVLCADAHFGYSMPIGGVVAYRDRVSPSGVGYDIGCGNKAVMTDMTVKTDGREFVVWPGGRSVASIMDEIKRTISFGVGLHNNEKASDPVLAKIESHSLAEKLFKTRSPQTGRHERLSLLERAEKQLGTVGSGNHYVDLLVDGGGRLWVGVHFGSRGFGHGIASGFLAMAQGKGFHEHAGEGEMESPPVLLSVDSPLGQDYLECMLLAGAYAYAGRNWVVDRVLRILGAEQKDSIHNHHNYAWWESHMGEGWWVVRKGATPAFPGMRGFVGGSMGDISVILEGIDRPESKAALYSTVHGAGRVMSRTEAKGKFKHGKRVKQGRVDWDAWNKKLKESGIVIRGGDADEAPECYRALKDVLAAHEPTIRVENFLNPIGVAMAGYNDGFDPYKD
jgi:tRNA-splicing ligase RtcB